jgi:ribosomal protein L11 methyltransferase
MEYQKITLSLVPDNEANRDILMATLGEVGYESFVENETQIEAYIQSDFWDESTLESLETYGMYEIEWQSESVPDQNWNEEWEKNYFQPLMIADKCLVRAPFHTDYPKAEFEIVIEPKMAFGTGNHETTSQMMEEILMLELSEKIVLDMGCGTGILAMLASMMGAKKITAIDIDKWAFESTVENCSLNNCNNVDAYMGDASLLSDQKFDVIFANIHKNILIQDIAKYNQVLNNEGVILMSGFYSEDLHDINAAAISLGWEHLKHSLRNNWVVSIYQKKFLF